MEIEFSFSSCRYLDVSVHDVPSITLWIHAIVTELFSAGFPHSDICGSSDICSLPQLFAAYHVLHRLLVPRHPPYALLRLINSSAELNYQSCFATFVHSPELLPFEVILFQCRRIFLLYFEIDSRQNLSFSDLILSFLITFVILLNFSALRYKDFNLFRSIFITLRLICNFQGPNSSLCELFEVSSKLLWVLSFRFL